MAQEEDVLAESAMVHEKKDISKEAKRNLIQHLMFGQLFVLIIMNWSFYRMPNYQLFLSVLDSSIIKEKERNNDLTEHILDAYVQEEENGRTDLHQFASFIKGETERALNEIEHYKNQSSNKLRNDDEKLIFDRIVFLRDSTLKYLGVLYDSMAFFDFPLNKIKIENYKRLLNFKPNIIQFADKQFRLSVIRSLEIDVLTCQSIYLNSLLNRIHDNYCGFEGYHAWFIPTNSFFNIGNKINSEICLVKDLPHDKWNFKKKYTVSISQGNVDSVVEYGGISWSDKPKSLGLHSVVGSINVQYGDINTTRPFSFSYFVSARGITLQLDKANTCYIGVPNPIRINIPGYPADKLKLTVANAKLTKKGDGLYEVYFEKMPREKVYAFVEGTNSQGHKSTVYSMELMLRDLPPPITNLSAYQQSGIEVDSFFSMHSLEVFSSDTDFVMSYEVISFQIEGILKNHKYFGPITVYGSEYTNSHDLMHFFNTASAGDRFIISNIRSRVANGRVYEALPVSFRLK